MNTYLNKIYKYPIHWALGGSDKQGGMEQNPHELSLFCEWLDEHKIKTLLEIGMAKGLFNKFLTLEMGIKCDGVTIDKGALWWKPENLIIGSSYDRSTVKQTGNYDLIFVDGDHDKVKKDYLAYKGKCIFMAFHDICGFRKCFKVHLLWKQLKKKYKYWEFIDYSDINKASGIGVIQL